MIRCRSFGCGMNKLRDARAAAQGGVDVPRGKGVPRPGCRVLD
ncbi:predicted protein [Streptomyces filamentosus NRRL 15998]|uniref:Predicted protein n=1 Tax=Streptomyces filamentosus NRRL 15998 TaxID=457431 RepID=D6AE72_STRFL|nr:predicted protein [Streptomyces filamentosus NRRL 15998]